MQLRNQIHNKQKQQASLSLQSENNATTLTESIETAKTVGCVQTALVVLAAPNNESLARQPLCLLSPYLFTRERDIEQARTEAITSKQEYTLLVICMVRQ